MLTAPQPERMLPAAVTHRPAQRPARHPAQVPPSASGGPRSVVSSMLWRSSCSLAVALQKGNFTLLSASLPAMDSEASSGCLGAQFSEQPEFWRSAPPENLEFASGAL